MKNIIAILLTVLCIVSCAACNGTSDTTIPDNTDEPTVTDIPETDAPETDAPETDEPETEPPVTEAPQTEAPETEPAVSPEAEEISVKLLPAADTYVVNDKARTMDFGNEERLRVKKDEVTPLTRNAFIKFDTSKTSFDAVTKAVIRIECQYLSKNEEDIKGRDVKLYAASSDWNECSFNWDTQPAIIEKICDVDSTLFVGYKWTEIDVTSYIKEHIGETITFMLCNEGVSSEGNYLDFNSSENAGHEPRLVIDGFGSISEEIITVDTPTVRPIVGGDSESWISVADTYVENKSGNPIDNGSSETLTVKKADAKKLSRNIYLKFNTDGTNITNINKATLRLYCTYVSKNESEIANRDMNLYAVSSNWTESSFDWTSQPAITEKVADIDSASFVAWNWIEIDVTDYVKAHSGNIISFVLMNEGVDSEENHLLFYSREKEGHEPQLVIE